MKEHYLVAVIGISVGLFAIICAYKDYEWFMTHRKAKVMTRILGRKGARIFYALIGFVLLVGGLVALVSAVLQP